MRKNGLNNESLIDKMYKFVNSRQAHIYFIELPTVHDIHDRTELERLSAKICTDVVYSKNIKPEFNEIYFENVKKKDFLEVVKDNLDLYNDCFVDENIDDIFDSDPDLVQNGSYFMFEDYHSNSMNISNGFRKGIEYKNNKHIFLFGNSSMFGYYVSDDKTIASFLQKRIRGYSVHNCATNGDTIENMYNRIISTRICENDIVVVGIPTNRISNINLYPHIDVVHLFEKNRKHENFVDKAHYTAYCHEWITDVIYNNIKKDFSTIETSNVQDKVDNMCNSFHQATDLDFTKMDVEVGAVVASCNPFTCGHRFLIETGSKIFDFFVVFLMQDGIDLIYSKKECSNLVKIGTQDLENVIVVDLSNVFSYQTFWSEYNNVALRHSKNYVGLNTIELLDIVGKAFKKLNIKHFLCGIETDDDITKQHITQAKFIFPQNGINVIQIPRKKINKQERISGTLCREYLQNEQYDKLENFIPKNVLRYIKNFNLKVQTVKENNAKNIINTFEKIVEKENVVDNMPTVDKNDFVEYVKDLRILLDKYNKQKILDIYHKKNHLSVCAGFAILMDESEIDNDMYEYVYNNTDDLWAKHLLEVKKDGKSIFYYHSDV